MALLPSSMPQTEVAVYAAALFVQASWVDAARSGRFITSRRAGAYVHGLLLPESLVYPWQGSPLQALVRNLAQYAGVVEEGSPAVHLPDVIRWSQSRKARRNKQGRFYLRIPFTHQSSGAQQTPMPPSVYRVARRLQPGQRLTAGPSHGQAVHAGGMAPYVPRTAANVRPGYTHAARQEGLRRVSRGRGSSYVTFRTMTQDSPGWTIPARPGTHMAAIVARQTTPYVQAMLEAAVLKDIEAEVRRTFRG